MKKYFLSLVLAVLTSTAFANVLLVTDTFAVDTLNKTTIGSLNYCVEQADDADTIKFDASLSGATIKVNNMLRIEINLTIDASDLAEPIHLDGQGQSRIMILGTYADKKTTDQTNAFCNLVFENGYNTNPGEAGAVDIFAKKVTFNHCQFLNNKSMDEGTSRQPGAIRNQNSYGSMYLNDCVFRGNETKRKGGAISIDCPTLKINRCLFDGNKAGDCGAAIDTKSGEPGGDNQTPIIEIFNTTFINHVCNYKKNVDGFVIFNGQSDDKLPMRIINCTFVNNRNETNSSASTVYSTVSNLTVAGNIFGGNYHMSLETESGLALSGDVRVGSNPGKLISKGYNYVYRMKPASEQDEYLAETDVEYRAWESAPLLKNVLSKDGVVLPIDSTLTNGSWKRLKSMPAEFMVELQGENAKDQLGQARTSKLCFLGAYEYPSYVLTVEDDLYGVTAPGTGDYVYLHGEKAIISSNSEDLVSWLINGEHKVGNPYRLVMDQDYTVVANYEFVEGLPDPQEPEEGDGDGDKGDGDKGDGDKGDGDKGDDDDSHGLNNTSKTVSATRVLRNGEVLIVRGQNVYDMMGRMR